MLLRYVSAFVLVLSWAERVPAASLTHQVVVGDGGVLNAWPGPDGQVGTGDDVVDGSPSPLNGSDANSIAGYSYNAFDFGGGPETTRLPAPMNAATFLQGTVEVDTTIATSGGGALISGWHLMGTQPFQGHGPYEAQILTVHGGTYDTGTRAFTLNVDFIADLVGGTAISVGFDLTGTAFYIEAADFGVLTGDSYVDNVLIPVAQALSAPSLLYIRGSGVVPASTGGSGGSFPTMPVEAAIVAVPEPSGWLLALAAWGAIACVRPTGRSDRSPANPR
jgi:hypothetical protein